MPEKAVTERATNQRAQRLDLYRNIDFTIPRIIGINQTLAPNLIGDDECQAIWNFLPIAKGVIRKIKSAKKLISTTITPIKMITHPLSGNYKSLIFFADGSVSAWDGETLTSVAGANTLSGNPEYIDFCVWENNRFYIIDKEKGYFKWDGTTWAQVSTAVKGHAITLWQGRVFICNGSQVSYSVALDPEDFAGSGSGYFDLAQSFPELKTTAKKIIPYIDSLIIYGDNAIMGLTGSTISNDPSTWYLTQVSNTIGVKNANNVVSYGNEVWLQNEKGLYRTTMSQQTKFDYKINIQNVITVNNYQTTICPINNLVMYLLPVKINSPLSGLKDNILVYCIDTGEFFLLDIGVNVYGIYRSYIEGLENRIYCLGQDGLYALFEGDDNINCYLQTKTFDFGRQSVEKLWYLVSIPIYLERGNFNFNLICKTDKKKSTVTKNLLVAADIYQNLNNNYKYAFSNASKVWGFYLTGTSKLYNLIFMPKVSGLFHEIILEENSNSTFDIFNMFIRAQIGRDII